MPPQYNQRFKEAWKKEEWLKDWVEGAGGDEYAQCKVCKKTFRAHFNDLRKHGETYKHKKEIAAAPRQRSLQSFISIASAPTMTQEMKDKSFELTMTLFAACHTTFRAVDPLCQILQLKFGKAALKLHRTKATHLVKKILGPYFRSELKTDLKDAPFSLLVDESTDQSTVKLVAIAVRYYSNSLKKIVSTYPGMEELPHADAISLEAAVRRIMEEWSLEGKNMVGLATDVASVMVGRHHSLQNIIRRTWPHVIHNSCTNHALDLVAKNAVKAALPSSVEYVLQASFNWFSHSASRIDEYRQIAELIGIGDEEIEDGLDRGY